MHLGRINASEIQVCAGTATYSHNLAVTARKFAANLKARSYGAKCITPESGSCSQLASVNLKMALVWVTAIILSVPLAAGRP
jgi:hypothetical protein